MKCKDVLEKMDIYFEKRLSEVEVAGIEKHLKTCEKCRGEFHEFENILDMLNGHQIVAPPLDFTEKVMKNIDKIDNVSKLSLTENMSRIGLSLVAAGLLIVSMNAMSINYRIHDVSSYIYKGSIEINQRITNPFGKVTRGLNYISEYWSQKI